MLVILMMLAPLRGVLAMQSAHCDMGDMPASVQMQEDASAPAYDNVSPDFSDMAAAYHHGDKSSQSMDHKCCCCDANSCGSDCDMGMAVSLLMQVSSYSPIFVKAEKLSPSSQVLRVRALTPPSRPPLILS